MTTKPEVERLGAFTVTGLLRQHDRDQTSYDLVQAIGRQWTDYMTRRIAPPWSAEARRYGVVLRMADGDMAMAYFCGALPPEPLERVPGFVDLTIPPLAWAVFPFDSHIIEFRDFIHTVFAKLLPQAELAPAADAPGVPEFIERYDWRFNPATGRGGFDLMVPVAA